MFNPQARWDRKLPGREISRPEEKIQVVARFLKGTVVPLYFYVSDYRYEISRIHYECKEKNGRDPLYYFSVSVGEDSYCLYLSRENMSWRLKRIE